MRLVWVILVLFALKGVLLLGLPSTFLIYPLTMANAGVSVIFYDNFDSCPTGYIPGGWELWFNKKAEVVSDCYVSYPHSLRLKGEYGWSTEAARRFYSDSRFIGYEVYGMVEEVKGPYSLRVGFLKRTGPTTATWHATITFKVMDGRPVIVAAGKELRGYRSGVWYKIKVVLDRYTRRYEIWINDSFVGYSYDRGDPWEIEAFGLSSEWAGVNCYFDNVKVFEVTYGQPEIEVVDHAICEYVENGKPQAITHYFMSCDSAVYCWVKFKLFKLSRKHTVILKWYDPHGRLYDVDELELYSIPRGKPVTFTKPIIFTYTSSIPIRGHEPERLYGIWKVKLYLDGRLAFEDIFEIRFSICH